MQHTTWLQNRTPAQALEGKTPYEMRHKQKPNLAGIQEFGAAAYVKDLKARKLDARAKLGRFVGYDSESKGFRIYWPEKRSVTVERNVVFNENDVQSGTILIPDGALSRVVIESPVRSGYWPLGHSNRLGNFQNPQKTRPNRC
jgi:hypothetical protein